MATMIWRGIIIRTLSFSFLRLFLPFGVLLSLLLLLLMLLLLLLLLLPVPSADDVRRRASIAYFKAFNSFVTSVNFASNFSR